MRWENIANIFRSADHDIKDEVKEIEPRPLTDREAGWIREILQTNDEWKHADISRTQVVAEGPCDEGLSILLQAPEPENPKASPVGGYIGRLWINNNDNSVIEVRLTHLDRRLRELFILFVDPKHPRRTLPESWIEVSHEALKM
ncbi:MAG TPA: hypothetical protein VFP59_12805 [Candidatus Angelobacter sp.]|nr:hypothetical protein [Candidatus Angelobacter sp.]